MAAVTADRLVCSVAPVEAVLRLAARVPVFPCRRNPEEVAVRGERKIAKAKSPLTVHGLRDASQDPAQIRAWWARWPDALVGVPTGQGTGLVVIDYDAHKADASANDWILEHSEQLLATRTHATLSGGRHYLFRAPAGVEYRNGVCLTLAGIKRIGIDVRAEGGYIVWWPLHGGASSGEAIPLPAGLIEEQRIERHELPPLPAQSPAKWAEDRKHLADALAYLEPAEYDVWARVGLAIHLASGGSDDGFQLWHAWSAGEITGDCPANYSGINDCRYHWASYRHDKDRSKLVTLGTVFELAKARGYQRRSEPRESPPVEAYTEDEMRHRVGQMLVTGAPVEYDADPDDELLDVRALDGKELLAEYDRRHARFGTTPFDPAGERLRLYPGGVTIWSGFPGAGKCLGKGTPVMLSDGSVKPVEEIRVGDLLMGPDSFPRQVLSLARGREQLYRVTPTKGDPYVVNESHILSLKWTFGRSERVVNLSVRDYLRMKPSMREKLKGWRTGVTWRHRSVPLDPYFLGAWLGDGSHSSATVWKPDEEVLSACDAVAVEHGLRAVRRDAGSCPSVRLSGSKGAANPVMEKLRALGVTEQKHVPLLYRANSRDVRLHMLAGLLDTDGALSRGGFDFVSVHRALADDVAYLARSLGLAAYVTECRKGCQTGAVGTYHRVSISGDCSIIPTRIPRKRAPPRRQIKRVTVTGISVEPLGEGDYFGFEISGDRLFLLGDFTVTHNTTLLRQLACHCLMRGSSVFFASLEEDPRNVLVSLAAVAAGREKPTAHQMQWFIDAYGERFRLWGVIGIAQHRRLLAVIRKLAESGLRHAIIDSLMCLDIANDDFEAQRKFANLLAATARASNVHIHLVAHPRKLVSADQDPDINDVAGAREIGGIADNVLFIRRSPNESADPLAPDTPMKIAIRKQRHGVGALGDIAGWFHRGWRQFTVEQFPSGPTRYLPEDAFR